LEFANLDPVSESYHCAHADNIQISSEPHQIPGIFIGISIRGLLSCDTL